MALRKTPRKQTAAPQPIREIRISFDQQELQFLVQALHDLPVSGTPDNLAQALPMIQSIRMKFATALQVAAGDGPQPEKPADPPAAE